VEAVFGDTRVPEPPAGQFRLLADHFFERFFYNDLISDPDHPQLVGAYIMAILAFPGLRNSLGLIPKYYVNLIGASEDVRQVAVLGDRWTLVTFSMIVLGFVVTFQWDRLFPDRRDNLILGVLPVPQKTVFLSQLWALAKFTALFFAWINAFPTLFFPIAAVRYDASAISGLWFAITHVIGMVAAGGFVVLFFVALQGALMLALGDRWFRRVSPWAQLTCLCALILALILMPLLSSLVKAQLSVGSATGEFGWLVWVPAAWFVGLAEWLHSGRAALGDLVLAGAVGTAATALVAGLCYWVAYQRYVRRSLESPANEATRGSWLGGLGRTWLEPREQVTTAFTLQTLARSGKHRLYFSAFVALGISLAVSQWLRFAVRPDAEPPLSIPYLLVFCALVGMRATFVAPADREANWVFRMLADRPAAFYQDSVRRAMVAVCLAPLSFLSAVVVAAAHGWLGGLGHLVVFSLIAWITLELLLFDFVKIPFTCTFQPPRAHIIFVWSGFALTMMWYSAAMPVLERWALGGIPSFVVFSLLAAGALIGLISYRRSRAQTPPIFEEEEDVLVHRLKLEP